MQGKFQSSNPIYFSSIVQQRSEFSAATFRHEKTPDMSAWFFILDSEGSTYSQLSQKTNADLNKKAHRPVCPFLVALRCPGNLCPGGENGSKPGM